MIITSLIATQSCSDLVCQLYWWHWTNWHLNFWPQRPNLTSEAKRNAQNVVKIWNYSNHQTYVKFCDQRQHFAALDFDLWPKSSYYQILRHPWLRSYGRIVGLVKTQVRRTNATKKHHKKPIFLKTMSENKKKKLLTITGKEKKKVFVWEDVQFAFLLVFNKRGGKKGLYVS